LFFPVHRRLPLVLTLVAWLLASGTQWDVVQSVAWLRMFAENARVLPLGAAVARTFSPEGRCELCGIVASAKQQREQAGDTVPGGQADQRFLLLAGSPQDVVIVAPESSPWVRTEPRFASARRAAPPLPPPRA